MSISETITRNDLTNILNEVLTAGSGMAVEDISDKITFGSVWSNYMSKAYLIGGKFVFFMLEGYAGTIMQGTQYTIATIASGYRPKDNLAFTGHATDANYLPQSTVNCYVWTSGDITVRCSNGNGNYVFISGWYTLAEGSAPVIVADYIVEQGTDGIWTYRKWNSGIAECWGVASSTTAFAVWTAPIYYGTTSVAEDFPTDLFNSVPNISVSMRATGADVWVGSSSSGGLTATNTGQYYPLRVGSSGSSVPYRTYFCAKGRWK